MTEEWQRLAPSARLLFHLQAVVRWVLFHLPLSIGAGFATSALWSWQAGLIAAACLAFGLAIAALWMPSLAYERYRYRLRQDDFQVHSGVLLRRLTTIPTSRVQHVDTHQGVLEQLFGLARVHVFTAAGVGADGTIPGLALEDAEALRDALVARATGDDGL